MDTQSNMRDPHKSSSHTYYATLVTLRANTNDYGTYIPKVAVQHLNVSVDNLQCDEFIVSRADPTHEEQRGVSAVHHFRVCPNV